MELIARDATLAIGRSASRALLRELAAYPKPGLVSRVDTGSHDDMHAGHFMRSAFVLRRYFSACARAGAQDAAFDRLRRLGVGAEVAMTRATGGVNTHRGAIFALGLLSAAAGARPATTLGEHVRLRWGRDIAAHRRDPASHGSGATRLSGAGGAQAEAAAGFPSIHRVALPAHRAAVRAGATASQAAVQAFFALLAEVGDTNLVHRAGVEGLRYARGAAGEFLAQGGVLVPGGMARAIALHREFSARRLSPGGCADLLAATLFVLACDPRAG